MELGLLWIVMAINSIGLIFVGVCCWVAAGMQREAEREMRNLRDRIDVVERSDR